MCIVPRAIVDAHHHLWQLDQGHYPWLQEAYDPAAFFLGDMACCVGTSAPRTTERASADGLIVATVHVEAERDRTQSLAETRGCTRCMRRTACRTRWWRGPTSRRPMPTSNWHGRRRLPLVRGVRCKPLTSREPASACVATRLAAGRALAQRPCAARASTTWRGTCACRFGTWRRPRRIAALFPRCASCSSTPACPGTAARRGLAALAPRHDGAGRTANVHVKLSEFGLPDAPWTPRGNARVIRETVAIFGWRALHVRAATCRSSGAARRLSRNWCSAVSGALGDLPPSRAPRDLARQRAALLPHRRPGR